MKLLYSISPAVKYLLCALIITTALHVNAQQIPLRFKAQQASSSSTNGNFTSFSVEKTYSDMNKLIALTPAEYRNNPDFGVRINNRTQWYEQIDKRTLNTRTFTGPGNEVIIENGYGNLNYVDANGWMRAVKTKLKPATNGWAAEQQEIPVYLYHDAITALSLGGNNVMTFNKNVRFNKNKISTTDYTVGDNGMYIKNAAPNTDKIIRFGRGGIETDYKIKQPLNLNGDLVISEDVDLPAGYTISENTNYNPEIDRPGGLIVKDVNGKTVAELKTPFCYDNSGNSITGAYHIETQNNGYRVDVEVPAAWINNPSRQYPVTIDPQVVGPVAYYAGSIIPSCYNSFADTASFPVTIPGGLTITEFFVQLDYYSKIKHENQHGSIAIGTNCIPLTDVFNADTAQLADTAVLVRVYGDAIQFSSCIKPSCSPQTIRLFYAISRDSIDSGCNANYMYYDPTFFNDSSTFAYIVGNTVQGSYTVPTICSNQCTFSINVTGDFGVPPYKFIHPWASDTISGGSYTVSPSTQTGASTGTVKLTLNIPNCNPQACTDSSLTIPPPKIIDACGDTVAGLSRQTVTITGAPNVTVTPDSQTICSGINVNIALSSCISGATYTWTSSQGVKGSGSPITNSPSNSGTSPVNVTYTVTPSGNGCTGDATTFPVTVTPFTVAITPANPSICQGSSTALTVSGEATSYSWSPSVGLSCITCNKLIANPTVTTTYVVTGASTGECSATDSVVVVVNPVPSLTVLGDTVIFSGDSAHLFAYSNDSVTWSPSTGLSCTNCTAPNAAPAVTTIYTATVVQGSCTTSKEVKVTVIEPCEAVHVPNAFTPDGTENRYLHVLNYGEISLQEFRVYNRWGEMVFQTNDVNGKWDGTYNGKPEPVGTYVYYVVVNCQGRTITVKGDVTLLR